jgi:hypothetical protein
MAVAKMQQPVVFHAVTTAPIWLSGTAGWVAVPDAQDIECGIWVMRL